MKRVLRFVAVILLLGAVAYPYRQAIETRLTSVGNEATGLFSHAVTQVETAAPCSQPITYSLGTFDTRFGISKSYFLSAIADAEAVWEKPYGKQFFTYVPDTGTLKINLVYDYRQEATSELASLGITVKDDQASYDTLKARYVTIEATYTSAKNSFDASVQAFNDKNASYEQQVSYWNAQGGAPESDFSELQTEQSALKVQSTELQTEQTTINEQVNEINALATAINSLANTLNLTAVKSNTIETARGESFEEGVYVTDGVSQHIDIYEFDNRNKLVRVLAHELGHAMGLGHVADPNAIMYKLNQSTSLTLAPDDIAALNAICGIK